MVNHYSEGEDINKEQLVSLFLLPSPLKVQLTGNVMKFLFATFTIEKLNFLSRRVSKTGGREKRLQYLHTYLNTGISHIIISMQITLL